MRISDWSSDVCSSDLLLVGRQPRIARGRGARVDRLVGVAEQGRPVALAGQRLGDVVVARIQRRAVAQHPVVHLVEPGVERGTARRAGCRLGVVPQEADSLGGARVDGRRAQDRMAGGAARVAAPLVGGDQKDVRSEEHTSELQSLMRTSYAVFCLKKKRMTRTTQTLQTA